MGKTGSVITTTRGRPQHQKMTLCSPFEIIGIKEKENIGKGVRPPPSYSLYKTEPYKYCYLTPVFYGSVVTGKDPVIPTPFLQGKCRLP